MCTRLLGSDVSTRRGWVTVSLQQSIIILFLHCLDFGVGSLDWVDILCFLCACTCFHHKHVWSRSLITITLEFYTHCLGFGREEYELGGFLVLVMGKSPPTILAHSICVQDVANKLGIAKYVLYTSPSSCLSLMAYVPTLQEQGRLPVGTEPFNDIPGVAPTVATDMPTMMLNYKIIPDVYDFFLRNCARLPEAHGVLINSYEELEHKCIEGIRDRIYGASSPQVSFNSVFLRNSLPLIVCSSEFGAVKVDFSCTF